MDAFLEYLSQVSSNIVQTFTRDSSFLSLWPMLIAGLLALFIISRRLRLKAESRGRPARTRLKTLRRALLPKWLITHPRQKWASVFL